MEVRNRKWSEEEFLERRNKVLALWPTGQEVDLDEAIEYHRKLPDGKVFSKVLDRGKKEGWLPLEVHAGHATIEETINHLKVCEDNGLDLLFLTPDGYTRNCRFEEAQRGIDESLKQGKSILNGYPFVNHGVKGLRRIVDSARIPILTNCVSNDEPMLCAEIGFAGGGTASGCNSFRNVLAQSKDYPMDKRILNNQYSARLAGYYIEHGAPIETLVTSQVHGYVPSDIASAVGIIQCLINAEQGTRYITLETPSQYNLTYDIAVFRTSRKLAEEYLRRFGYGDVRLMSLPWSWQGEWPRDEHRAAAMVAWHATISTLAGADWMDVRSLLEGVSTPSPESSVAAIKIAKQVTLILANQRMPETEELSLEQEMLEMEIRAIVDRIVDLGDGDVAVGGLRAVEEGVIDVPMSPWIHVAGKVLPVKDRGGVLRWLDHGNLPLPERVVKYHRQKIAEREKAEHREAGIEMLIDDVFRLSRATRAHS